MKQIYFFGLKEDLLPMLALVESKGALKYVRTGNFLGDQVNDSVVTFGAGAELPNLGKATADQWTGCDSFLVSDPTTPINLRALQAIGGDRVCLDQLENPDSIVFNPGGVWSDDVVLNGCIGTASESQVSQTLMKRFQAAIKKSFTKVKAFYVGPNALKLLESGIRLAGAVQSPRELDLSLT